MGRSGAAQLRIGELAAELGLNPKTIRYYEEIGLLPQPRRTQSGYRLYDGRDLERLRFIGKAKAIGLSLEEIGDILALRRDGQQPCEHVLALLDRKLNALEEHLRALTEFRQDLVALRESAAKKVTRKAHFCRLIEQHEPRSRADASECVGTSLPKHSSLAR